MYMPINYGTQIRSSRFKVNLSYVLRGKFKGILGYMGPCLINKSIKQNPNNIE